MDKRCSAKGCNDTANGRDVYCKWHRAKYFRDWKKKRRDKLNANRAKQTKSVALPYDEINRINDGCDIPEPGRGIIVHGIRLHSLTAAPPIDWIEDFTPALGIVKQKILERGYRVTGIILRSIKTHPPR